MSKRTLFSPPNHFLKGTLLRGKESTFIFCKGNHGIEHGLNSFANSKKAFVSKKDANHIFFGNFDDLLSPIGTTGKKKHRGYLIVQKLFELKLTHVRKKGSKLPSSFGCYRALLHIFQYKNNTCCKTLPLRTFKKASTTTLFFLEPVYSCKITSSNITQKERLIIGTTGKKKKKGYLIVQKLFELKLTHVHKEKRTRTECGSYPRLSVAIAPCCISFRRPHTTGVAFPFAS